MVFLNIAVRVRRDQQQRYLMVNSDTIGLSDNLETLLHIEANFALSCSWFDFFVGISDL